MPILCPSSRRPAPVQPCCGPTRRAADPLASPRAFPFGSPSFRQHNQLGAAFPSPARAAGPCGPRAGLRIQVAYSTASDRLFQQHPTSCSTGIAGRPWRSEARCSSLIATLLVKGVIGAEGCPREEPARPAPRPPRGWRCRARGRDLWATRGGIVRHSAVSVAVSRSPAAPVLRSDGATLAPARGSGSSPTGERAGLAAGPLSGARLLDPLGSWALGLDEIGRRRSSSGRTTRRSRPATALGQLRQPLLLDAADHGVGGIEDVADLVADHLPEQMRRTGSRQAIVGR